MGNRLSTELVVKSVIEGIHFYKTEKSERRPPS